MNIYFVYVYKNPDSLIPFYVGLGKNQRHLSHLKEAKRNPNPKPTEHKLNTIRKLINDGKEPIIEIVSSNLTKLEAIREEQRLIAEIGRKDLGTGPLTNQTMGGDGVREWSKEMKNKMSTANKGKISVKDPLTGEKFKISKDDERWLAGELVGQNKGDVDSNCNGKLDGYILAKNPETEEVYRVKQDDPRWVSGELVGYNKNKKAHPNTIAAAKAKKGIPKSEEHNKKVSQSIKQLKWYHNFDTGITKRFKENEQSEGFVRVSGPHKKEII